MNILNIDFSTAEKIYGKLVRFSDELSVKEVYERMFDYLLDHCLVKHFMKSQGYSIHEISNAKYRLRKERENESIK